TVSFSGQRVAAMRRRRSSSAACGTIGTVKGRIAVESCAAVAAADVWTATTDVMAATRNITDPKAKEVFMKPPVVRTDLRSRFPGGKRVRQLGASLPNGLGARTVCDPTK